jgi:competence protein ComEA
MVKKMKNEDKKLLFALSLFVIAIGMISVIISLSQRSENKAVIEKGNATSVTNVNDSIYIFPMDINIAKIEHFISIDGIGEKTAQQIIEYRDKIGGYKSMEQLLEVNGIGEKTLEKLKQYFYVINNNTVSETMSYSDKQSVPNITTTSVIYPIDINFATYEELLTLKGIGEAKAKEIINYRTTKGYFYSIEDIMLVNGIGHNIYNNIKDKIKVDLTKIPPQKQVTTFETTSQPKKTTEEVTSEELSLHSINVNTATFEELMKIPGIKDYTAKAIIEHRENKNCEYKKIEEIEFVLSVQKTNQYNQIKDYLTI